MEEEKYKGYKIKIEIDEDPIDPREDDGNLGIMACKHPNYELGDKTDIDWDWLKENLETWADIEKYLIKNEGAVAIAPLWLYDHSGLRMKIGSFSGLLPQGHAEFDTVPVGFIYTTRAKILECFGVKRITKEILVRARQNLEAEVKTYDSYISGSVFGWVTEGADGERVDSCWGYYDTDSAMNDARESVDAIVKEAQEKHEVKLKGYIRNKVALNYRFTE